MAKMQIISCASTLLLITSLNGQSQKTFAPDTAKQFEIGTNISPLIIFALGSESPQNFTLCFRKQHHKRAFQIKAVYYKEIDFENSTSSYNRKDSITNYRDTYYQPQKFIGLAAGLEFYNPNKKIRWFWGFDLLGRYYINSKSQSQGSFIEDSPAYPFSPWVLTSSNGAIDIYQWAVGAALKGGVRLPISKHFALQAETQIDFYYLFNATTKTCGDVSGMDHNSATSFNINMQALIPEVTLYYRF